MVFQAIRSLDSSLSFSFNGDIETEADYKKITWFVGVDENNTSVPGIPESIPTWAEVQAEIKRIKPMIEWEQKMRGSDSLMSRERENSITKIDKGIADNAEEQKRYDEKIALRETKPS